jgi:hypothetical protein
MFSDSELKGIDYPASNHTYKNYNYNDENKKEIRPSHLDILKKSRYQKAYKSFKSVMRRGSNSSIQNNYKNEPNHTSILNNYDYDNDLPKLERIDANFLNNTKKSSSESTNEYKLPEINLFQNDYSYEKCDNNNNVYDYSVYPYTKSLNNLKLCSKSVDKVNIEF